MSSQDALLGATALHAGFQLVVTVLVYPVLAATPVPAFARAHDLHSRRIIPLVAIIYALAAAACLWVLVGGPLSVWTLLACAGTALAAGTTALVAGPTHGRIGQHGPTPELLRRLLVSDRVRLAGTLVALAGALLAV